MHSKRLNKKHKQENVVKGVFFPKEKRGKSMAKPGKKDSVIQKKKGASQLWGEEEKSRPATICSCYLTSIQRQERGETKEAVSCITAVKEKYSERSKGHGLNMDTSKPNTQKTLVGGMKHKKKKKSESRQPGEKLDLIGSEKSGLLRGGRGGG